MRRTGTLLLLSAVAAAACSETPQRSDALPDRGRPDGGRDGRPREAGDFQADLVGLGSDRCLGAPGTSLGVGKLELQGTTAGASNEYGNGVRCGESGGLAGPQRYYRLELEQGLTYRFELRPSFEAALLLAASCGLNAMNADCGSQGSSGDFVGSVPAGGSGTITFTAPVTGSYRLAVDSASSAAQGPFTLLLEGFAAPANGQCSQAQPLTLTGAKLSVEGNTLGSRNEFPGQLHCGLGVTLDGPQVYYTVSLNAGSWYRFGLAPTFPATLLVASTAAECQAPNLEVDCGGLTGTVLPLVAAGSSAGAVFSPPVSGGYLLAVTSLEAKAAGSFTLEVESFTPPGNMTCAAASPLAFSGGSTTATGTTQGYLNDRGALVRCGPSAPLLGPQAYYSVALKQVTYELLLKPSFTAVLAIGESCQTLPADCGSGGLSGAALVVPAGKTGSTLFTPAAAGTLVVAVDSFGESGAFSLEVKEHLPPQNGLCGQPKILTLNAGTALESGDTSALKNDLSSVSCGLSAVGPWSGPQAYHRVALQGGKSYQAVLQPEASFDPALYAFPSSTVCTTAAVNAACGGHASDQLGFGVSESLLLAPAADTEMILVVDSWSSSEVGAFTLSISEK